MEELKTLFDGEKLTVYVGGEIDHHSAKGIRAQIDRHILEKKPKQVMLELSAVTFMDSSGLGLIMGRYALCCDIGCKIFMAGLEKIVPIERI